MIKKSIVTLMCVVMLAFGSGCPEVGIIEDGLVDLDKVPQLEIIDVSANTITMSSQDSSPVSVGDVIVAMNPSMKSGDIFDSNTNGLLRRVTAMFQKGSDITVQTEKADLTDVVENGTLLQTIDFSPDVYAKSGLKMSKMNFIDLSGTDIYRDYGIALTIANGTLDCNPEVTLFSTFENFKLEQFNLNIDGDLALDIDLQIAVDEGYTLAFEDDIIPPIVYPFATAIGPLPVYGAATLSFPFGVIGTFDGDTSAMYGCDITNEFLVNIAYDGDGWVKTSDLNNWQVYEHPLVWSVDIGFGVEVYMKAIVEVSLYESAELGLFVKPYLNTDLHIVPSPASLVMTIGVDGGGWYGLEIFGIDLLGDSFYLNGPTYEILREYQLY